MSTRVECPKCKNNTLVLEEGNDPRCRCGYSGDAGDVADRYIQDVLGVSRYETTRDGDSWPLHTCPSCDVDAMVEMGKSGEGVFICFGCARTFKSDELVMCDGAGSRGPHWTFSFDAAVCDACMADVISSDNT